jgi:anaerobic selenocysteine-containing dehydrogenase
MDKAACTRRQFIVTAAVGSGAAILTPEHQVLSEIAQVSAEPESAQSSVQVIAGLCHECHVQCSMLVHVSDRRVVKVEGNPNGPNRGALCAKGQSTIKNLYSPERLNYPMKRTQPKGDSDPGWVRISWEEALTTIVTTLKRIKEQYGAHSIAIGQGTGRYSEEQSMRLKNSLGTSNWIVPSHVCYAPMRATVGLTVGHDLDAENGITACQVYWGKNPAWSHAGMVGRPMIDDLLERKSKLIVVDPRFEHPLAHKADIFLPVRPGSDGALLLSWIHVILSEGLYNKEFVSKWTNAAMLVRTDTLVLLREAEVVDGGDARDFLPFPECIANRANRPILMIWDAITERAVRADTLSAKPALFGKYTVSGIECKPVLQLLADRAAKYPPERVAELCWTGSAEKIRAAARMYASAPSASMEVGGQGIEGHTNTFQTLRAQVILAALTGNINRAGGLCGAPHWKWVAGQWKRDGGPRTMAPWGAQGDEYSIQMQGPHPVEPALNQYPLQPGQPSMIDCFRAMKSGQPYPIKAYLMVQGNPLGGWCEDQKIVREGLQSLEFLVDMDLYITPTNNLADIVLPAGLGPFERGDSPVSGPMFERWSDEKFYIELGRRMNATWWPWKTEQEWRAWKSQVQAANTAAARSAGFTVENGAPKPPLDYYKSVDPKTGRAIGFPTPTGRIEIFSVIAQQHGFDPLPDYTEPADSPYTKRDLASRYPLVLTTGARPPVFYHSQHRNNYLQRQLYPHPEVEINNETAEKFRVKHGDWVWIESRTGRIRMKAKVTPGILPGVVSLAHGWWQGCRELGLPGYGWDGANANMLVSGDAHDEALGVPAPRSQLCTIYQAEAPPYVWDPPYYGSTQPRQYSRSARSIEDILRTKRDKAL